LGIDRFLVTTTFLRKYIFSYFFGGFEVMELLHRWKGKTRVVHVFEDGLGPPNQNLEKDFIPEKEKRGEYRYMLLML